ncbi:MAG: hypothetical protein ACP5R5_12595, partial [Armatimonadota bacterium]
MLHYVLLRSGKIESAMLVVLLLAATYASPADCSARWTAGELRRLERSYWLHASLGASLIKGYWAKDAPVGPLPTAKEIRNACNLLVEHYGTNRLYLVYHNEITPSEFGGLLKLWRKVCPGTVQLVPTLVLRRYDKQQAEVFSATEISEVCAAIKSVLRPQVVAVYDVVSNRDQGAALDVLAREFRGKSIHVGIQPDEEVKRNRQTIRTLRGVCCWFILSPLL